MPIKTTCPECDKVYNLADTMEGKTVKCKGCGEPFTVAAVADIATAVAAKPSNGKAKLTAKAVKPAVKKRVADDDEDEDDEDEDEAPAKKKGGVGKWLLIGGGLAAVLMLVVCGGVGLGGYLLWKGGTSSDTAPDTASNTNTTDKGQKPPENNPPPPPATKKVTLANYQQIKVGMTIAQAEDLLGAPITKIDFADKRTTVATWVSVPDTIDITFSNGQAQKWSAFIDRKGYGSTDPSTGPGTNPGTGTGALVTRANFDKIKGGMQKVDLQLLLGYPTEGNARPDGSALPFVSDKGSAQVWRNGADSITVAYNRDGKAAAWSGNFNGQAVGYLSDPTYVVKPGTPPGPGSVVTKANFDAIKGGMSEQDLKTLLGNPTNANYPLDQESIKLDKPREQTWANGTDTIFVTFSNNKAARWYAMIGGQMYGPTVDPMYAIAKGGNPNPNPGSKLSKAQYNKIIDNQTTIGAAAQLLGAVPMNNGNNGKRINDPGFRLKFVWVDGNARIDAEVNGQGIVTKKTEQGLK